MCTYDQTVAKKGSDDVASMLYHFVNTYLDPAVKKLYVFADSCWGQNKNHTIIQFPHYVTADLKRFDTMAITYPVRGNSFMERKLLVIIDKSSTENQKRKSNVPDIQEPNQLYHSPIPLPKEKCADLKVLMKFCEKEGSKDYYSQLLSANRPVPETESDDVPDDQSDF
ncbi:unnamed protein product [Psylliodes chrysocephalus]|uniref:Uncharacterized protein n=1 Tax=Psylliodes chrysocephalus TaxID=3402493 RepID=A0A9P0CUQ7_9CUCU|nr:unnamed protein product [Psylliodes chrysocephala]